MSQEIIAQERARIKAISNAPGAKEYPSLTDLLCDSDYSAELCISILAAAMESRETAMAEAAARPEAEKQAYVREHPGALGIGTPSSTEERPGMVGADGWRKAVTDANRSLGDGAVTSDPSKRGWGGV